MKRDLRCTSCGSGSIWHFASIAPSEVIVNGYVDTSKPFGEQEQYICARCGLTESYALHVDRYREDPKRGIRLLGKSLAPP